MNGSRSSPPRHGDRSSLDALSRTIEGLEARIEGLAGGTSGREPRRNPDYDDRRSNGRVPPQQNALDEIRQRQRMLDSGTDSYRSERNNRYDERPAPRDYRAETPEPRRTWQPSAPAREVAPARGNQQDIAQSLMTLRQELKQDIREGISREIGDVLSEMRNIKSLAGTNRVAADDMRGDLARLADGIGQISRQARPDDAASLRAEFEDLKGMMDNLAREDSLRRMESRWNGVEERLQGFNTNALQDELVSLAYRLDDIKSQLGSMSQSPAIRTMEERMLALATALDEAGKRIIPNDRAMAEQLSGLDRRLEEISRAISATPRNANPSFDPAFLQRLESRIGALATQIDQIGVNTNRPDTAYLLGDRLEALAERIEDIASERSANRLEERLDALSAMLETRQPVGQGPDLSNALFDISRKIDALDHGVVNDTLAERLDRLARRIEEIGFQPQQPFAAFDDSAFRRLENQIGGIAARLDETASAPVSDNRALANLEAQIANLSHLISQPGYSGGSAAAGLSPEFEHRMSAIEDYIATSDEYIIEAARQAAEAVLDGFMRNGGALQHGASGPAPDLSALSDLANDLRQLEDLTRNSEERTHRTFEALHDTLLQIAGRLEHLDRRTTPDVVERREPPQNVVRETVAEAPMFASAAPARTIAPVYDEEGNGFFEEPPVRTEVTRSPAEVVSEPEYPSVRDPQVEAAIGAVSAMAPAAAAKKSLLGSLTQRFKKKDDSARVAEEAVRALVEPTPPIAADEPMIADVSSDELLEPGSGVPDVKKILARVRASQQGKAAEVASESERSDYIAAARRAAQVAARELTSEPKVAKAAKAAKPSKASAKASAPAAANDASGSLMDRYRRPVLLAVGAVLLVMMSMPLVNNLLGNNDAQQQIEAASPPTIEQSAPQPQRGSDAGQSDAAVQQASIAAPTDSAAPSGEAKPADAAPDAISAAPSTPVETVPLAPANSEGRGTDTAALDQSGTLTAIAVPAEIQPASLADAARSGDPMALFEIGTRYTNGANGVAANMPEAAKWYQQAADKGFAPAQYRVANLYEKGTGVAPDAPKAMDYYRKAAEQGNASAMHNLAVMYASGSAGTPDFEAAAKWFQKAADLGVSDSQFNLAILYARGNGVARDLEESYKWFAVAAKGGDKDAAQKRDEVANALRPEQLTSARAKAELWTQQPLDSKANEVVVPDEWAGKGLKTATVDMKKAIRNIQAILNNNGYDAGEPDGNMGKKTVAAIKAFQKSIGQEPTGKINDELVKSLLARNK